MKHEFAEIRIPIESDNPAVRREESLCIKCGQCRQVCEREVAVGRLYDLKSTNDTAICVHCGQCANVCPVDSIKEVYEYRKVKEAVEDPEKIVIFSTSPSVRVGLGEEFGYPAGSFVEGKMVAALRSLGADYVLDTNFAADLTIMEEASELVERVTEKTKPLPQFTSCCPAWVKFAETFYPEILPHISSAKSPIGMQGPTIKTYFAKQNNLDAAKIVNVAVTPCTAKKFEIRRGEMNISAVSNGAEDMRDMDHVITTRELARWMREEGIDLKDLPDSSYDSLMGAASGAGVIFGNTGGVMEAAARTAYYLITGENPPEDYLKLEPVRGMAGIRKAEVVIAGVPLKLAVIHGLENARQFIDRMTGGEQTYDFVEIMTCPGGCIGGGGQPKTEVPMTDAVRQARITALYDKDASMTLRYSHENPDIKKVYEEYYIKPLSAVAEKLLHTQYHDRSADLGTAGMKEKPLTPSTWETAGEAGQRQEQDNLSDDTTNKKEKEKENKTMAKFKCTVCGYIHEGDNPPEVCPICKVGADKFVRLEEEKTGGGKYAGTKTEKNLMEAFAGESQARNKYSFFAEIARQEGMEQTAAIFTETAEQERQHAKMWFSEFHGLGDTAENLQTAADGENEEWSDMYKRMAKEAREEGFEALAVKFDNVAKVEASHEKRYLKILETLKAEKTFKGDAPLGWKCRQCGFIYEGEEAPERCPACGYSRAYFERKVENY
ncbi:rubrerythrin [[Clostridium] hylemonae]|uniref:rubrerythrin n=1 Tax=[Clostridium] hylemonae TaxID=89153 RepID=UPI001105F1F0|nr:[FeFe] hydrogenase, group A [[Clostridium] hylemonae]